MICLVKSFKDTNRLISQLASLVNLPLILELSVPKTDSDSSQFHFLDNH